MAEVEGVKAKNFELVSEIGEYTAKLAANEEKHLADVESLVEFGATKFCNYFKQIISLIRG